MLVLLSPAKTIDPDIEQRNLSLTVPRYIKDANYLAGRLKKLKINQLQELFKVNSQLARLNYERYQFWQKDAEKWDPRASILSFKGEVFRGLEAWTLTDQELSYSQQVIRILSGLYGILTPLDKLQPYRLEMGIPLENRRGKDLYAYWSEVLTKHIKKELAAHTEQVIINLASREYSQAIDFKKTKAKIFCIQFKDFKNGKYKFLTVYGKHARGSMARFIIQNKIEDPMDLRAFDTDGYAYNSRLSSEGNLVFTRG